MRVAADWLTNLANGGEISEGKKNHTLQMEWREMLTNYGKKISNKVKYHISAATTTTKYKEKEKSPAGLKASNTYTQITISL